MAMDSMERLMAQTRAEHARLRRAQQRDALHPQPLITQTAAERQSALEREARLGQPHPLERAS
jgi:hypothetical protein